MKSEIKDLIDHHAYIKYQHRLPMIIYHRMTKIEHDLFARVGSCSMMLYEQFLDEEE